MATSDSGGREAGGEEGGGSPQLVLCPTCDTYTRLLCENCRNSVPQKVNVRAEDVTIVGNQVTFMDCGHGLGNITAVLKRTNTGNLCIKKAKTLNIVQKQIVVQGTEAMVSVATEADQLEDASDEVFMMRADWNRPSPEPSPPSQGTEVLLTRLINEHTDNFFLKVLEELLKENVPEDVIQSLYDKFRLRLLGLTKRLEILMEVEAERVDEIKGRKAEVQEQLVRLVPEDQRAHVTWREFHNIPVQCCDDVQPGDRLPSDVEADSAETITGALSYACKYGTDLSCKKLLKHQNADVTARNRDGKAPFHIACAHGQSHVLDMLLKAGASINEPDRDGWSPLHLACGPDPVDEDRRLSTVQWLLDHGADVHCKTPNDQSVLDLAKMGGYKNVVDILSQHI